MSKHKLFIDFDSTSVNSTKRLVEMMNNKFNQNHNWRTIKKYSALDLFPQATEEDVLGCFSNKEFFNGLEIFDNFMNVMNKYKDVFHYHIATIGTVDNIKHKQAWCNEHFNFPYEFSGIIKNGTGKGEIDMSNSIFIDDHINNLRTSNANIKVLYKGELETDWNMIDDNLEHDKLLLQVKNWYDVDAVLDRIFKNWENNYKIGERK